MPYDIPQNLKYEEKIAFNLSFVQMVWLTLFGVLGAIVFLKAPLVFELRTAMALGILGVGFGFAFLNFFGKIKDVIVFSRSIRGAGFLDKKILDFVEVKKIESDTIFLKNGEMKAVVSVLPIGFSILSEEKQKAITSAFRDFLNSLDFPIQIVMRTVDLNLDEYLSALKQRVVKSGKNHLLAQFDSFEEFVTKFIEEKSVKNRQFYIVVPNSSNTQNNFLQTIASFFSKQKHETQDANQLGIRVEQCCEQLKKCNLLTQRLNTNELLSLLASFFEGTVETGNNYFSPITLLEKFETKQESVVPKTKSTQTTPQPPCSA